MIVLTRLLSGVRPRWHGLAPIPSQRVYFANHTSHLDALVIWTALPDALRTNTRPVAAADYWTASPGRRWIAGHVLHVVLVERRRVTPDNNPLNPLLAALDAGNSLIFFPEGGRQPGPEPAPFKGGLFHLARKRPAIDLVPVYLENLNRVLPRGEALPVPMLGSMTLGQPIRLQDSESKPAFLERARLAVWNLRLA